MPLSDTTCRTAKSAKNPRKLSDGGGLQLWIQPNGSRLWRLAYRFSGKQKLLSLGAYPTLSLSEAREAREQAKKLLHKGVDPSEDKRKTKSEMAAAATTFQNVADEYLTQQRQNQRAATTLTKLEWLLEFARPKLGARPIADIRPADVLLVLREVEERGRHETARRLRSTIGCVFRLAVATGRAENDPTAPLRGALARPPHKPRAAVTEPKAFGALLRAIDGFEGQPTTKAALKLLALLFPRPGELRGAEWSEFDLNTAIWGIPARRTKMRRAHCVPLPSQALAILAELKKKSGISQFVFPSIRTGLKPISENTLNAALRRLGYSQDEATSHGFRASASTLLNESGRWHADAIERQLAHMETNDVRRAYARGEHWEERVRMMQWWASHLDDLKSVGKIIPLSLR